MHRKWTANRMENGYLAQFNNFRTNLISAKPPSAEQPTFCGQFNQSYRIEFQKMIFKTAYWSTLNPSNIIKKLTGNNWWEWNRTDLRLTVNRYLVSDELIKMRKKHENDSIFESSSTIKILFPFLRFFYFQITFPSSFNGWNDSGMDREATANVIMDTNPIDFI